MPTAPLGYCLAPGCNQLRIKDKKYCAGHVKQTTTEQEKARNAINSKVYSTNWRRLRLIVLKDQPLCRLCLSMTPSVIRPSVEVDHILPVKDRPDLQYTISNLQALCCHCHSVKTRQENNNK